MDTPSEPRGSLLRVSDLEALGYTRFQIRALVRRGVVTRMTRGLYYWTNAPLSSHSTIAAVGRLVPNGIICLMTALRFHDIGTQNPASIWVAVPSHYRAPRLANIALTVVHFGGIYRKAGVENVRIDGVSVKITNPARTVVDCFRFRNKVGLDIAIEALEDGAHKKTFSSDDLVRMAKQCGIYTVMKPYMETVYR